MSKKRDLGKELREAYRKRPLDVLRVRVVNHNPEVMVRVRKTGKIVYITADKIEPTP